MSSYFFDDCFNAEGVFLWGAYVDRAVADPLKAQKAPVLTLGAELDGGDGRIMRIAESFDQMQSSSFN